MLTDDVRLVMTLEDCCGSWEMEVSVDGRSFVVVEGSKCDTFSVEVAEDPKRRYNSSWLVKFGGMSGISLREQMF